jgi:hypothetical protein
MNHYLLELLNFNFTKSRKTANYKNNFVENSRNQPKLFCIAHDLPPLKTPIANRANKILSEIQKTWQIHVLTGQKNLIFVMSKVGIPKP